MNTKIDKREGVEAKEEVDLKVPTGDKATEATPTPKMRQIVVETDGNSINLVKAEVSGRIELIGVLQGVINFLNNQK